MNPNAPMGPSAATLGPLRALLQLAAPHRRQFVLIALLALLGTAADLCAPLIYRVAVNDMAGLFVEGGGVAGSQSGPGLSQEDGEVVAVPGVEAFPRTSLAPRSLDEAMATLVWAALGLLVVNLSAHFLQLAADQRTTRLASRIEAGVVLSSFDHALRLPLGYFSRRASAGVARQIDQLDQVAPIVTAAAHEVAPEIMRMAGVLAIMYSQSWQLATIALLALVPYALIMRRSALRLQDGLPGYYERWEGISARIQDALGALKTVKLSGAEGRETERLRQQTSAAYQQYIERNRLANFYQFWQTTVNYTSQALMLGFGGYLVLQGRLTPGDVVMFVAYLDRLFTPIESLAATLVPLQGHLASFARSLNLQQSGQEEAHGAALAAGPGAVEFRSVTFCYTAGRAALQDLSLTVPAGRVTALVGPSGAGKTTVTDLLLRLYDPQAGVIFIDDQDIAGVEPASIRSQVGVVFADGAVFPGSLADNIRYKRPQATDAEVEAAAIRAGLSPTIERLPQGLATEVGERGIGLSMGERQRLQIARVLVGAPRILVLDEATANVDYATENDIRQALRALAPRPTILVVAHRYSMVRDADHVVVLEGGRVTAQGAVAEVLASNAWFASFAAATERGITSHGGGHE